MWYKRKFRNDQRLRKGVKGDSHSFDSITENQKRFKLTSSISAVDLRTRMRLKCEGNKCKAVILAQKIQQQYEIKARAHSEYVEGGCWPWNSLMTKTTIFRSKSFGTPSTKCTWLVIRFNRH